MEKLKSIDKYGKQAKGRKELIAHLEGKRLTLRQMILAKCYDCMGFFADGRVDCNIPECALYPVMIYRKGEKYRVINLSDDQKAALKKRGRSTQRKTPSFAPEMHPLAAGEKENPGGIPNPPSGETESSSTVKNHFPGITPGITPGDQAPDPSQVRKSGKRGRKPKEREQIPLFPLKGIHNPYPGGKGKISGRKQASSIQK